MKKALILHAWYSKPEDNWYPWLKTKLEVKNYQVFSPRIPTFDLNIPQLKRAGILPLKKKQNKLFNYFLYFSFS